MPAPLSIILPTLNAAQEIGPTLRALVAGVEAGLVRELIIADGGSTDDIADIAEAVGAKFLAGPPGRGGQLGRGAQAAQGEWLLFVHADTVLAEDWPALARRHMERAAMGPDQAAAFRLAFDDDGVAARWVAGWANLRTRWFALPYGDQGLLISRALYDAVGGFRDIPLMEDVALARAVGRRRLTLLPSVATTSAARYRREGWFRRGVKNWTCLALYFAGVAPERIAERYR